MTLGREWVFAKIARWLANADAPQHFIITEESDIGKTVFEIGTEQL